VLESGLLVLIPYHFAPAARRGFSFLPVYIGTQHSAVKAVRACQERPSYGFPFASHGLFWEAATARSTEFTGITCNVKLVGL
jgi:hypothetical protein